MQEHAHILLIEDDRRLVTVIRDDLPILYATDYGKNYHIDSYGCRYT